MLNTHQKSACALACGEMSCGFRGGLETIGEERLEQQQKITVRCLAAMFFCSKSGLSSKLEREECD